MARIVIVTSMFDTVRSRIQTAIACALSRTHEVIVVCGEEGLPAGHDDSHFFNTYGIRVVRCKYHGYERNRPWERFAGLMRFTKMLSERAAAELSAGDTVLIDTDPSLLLLAVARMKRRYNFRMAVLVHDLFPENTIAAGLLKKSNPFYRLALNVFNKAYRQADLLIAIGSDMKRVLQQKVSGRTEGPNVKVVTNWAFHTTEAPLSYPVSKKITLMFAGTVGRLQGLENIVASFGKVHNPHVRLEIHGGGAKRSEVEQEVARHPESDIDLNPPYDKDSELTILSKSDISLVSLVDGMFGLGVPSKTYTIMMSGRPILYIGERGSEVWEMVEKEGIGFCFTPDDEEGLVLFLESLTPEHKTLLQEMGRKARETCMRNYKEEIVLDKLCALFE